MAHIKNKDRKIKENLIETTKELIKTEGIANLNARVIAESANCQYSVIYELFKDLNELIGLAVFQLLDDCYYYLEDRVSLTLKGYEKIKAKIIAYLKFFIEYKGVYDLFYFSNVGNINERPEIHSAIINFFDKMCIEDWDYVVAKEYVAEKKVEFQKKNVKIMITGFLVYHINRNTPDNLKDFLSEVDNQLESLFYENY